MDEEMKTASFLFFLVSTLIGFGMVFAYFHLEANDLEKRLDEIEIEMKELEERVNYSSLVYF